MALKLYLIRHGETDFNKNKDVLKMKQEIEISLNRLGVLQSEKLASRLKNIPFAKIFSSPLNRAIQTANKLGESFGKEIIPDDRLKEYEPGEVDPSSEKWKEKYNEMLASGMSKYDIRPFGGDNIWDLINRVESFLKSMQKEEGIVAVVAHSGVNEMFINLSQKKEKPEFLKFKQDNTCINILEFSNGKWEIRSINDSTHITDIIPKKNIYLNQEKIKETVEEYVINKLGEISNRIYLGGDIITKKFGSYDRPYKRNKGSTVEVYAQLKEDFKIPQEWKISLLLEDISNYEVGSITIEGTKHKVNLTLLKDDKDVKGIKLAIKK